MATIEERTRILKLVEDGRITADEGSRLLAALVEPRRSGADAASAAIATTGGPGRWLRIRVTDMATGRTKVTVNVPLALVTLGLRFGARFVPEDKGVDVDAVMEAIHSGLTGRIVDVQDEEDGEHVEIFVE
jgi:hypothetical protein